jgi:hypothetical protein
MDAPVGLATIIDLIMAVVAAGTVNRFSVVAPVNAL